MTRRLATLLAALLLCVSAGAQQIYNMSFDHWSKKGVTWYPYPEGASGARKVWDSANPGIRPLGTNVAMPEYKHVAVPGPGKAAAKVVSKKVLWAFLTGNLYTGEFVRVVKLSGAEMYDGVPFSGRPSSMSGYCHYIPGVIDYAKAPYLSKKGKKDEGQIEVALYGWKERKHFISNDGPSTPASEDPALIGRAVMVFSEDTGGYIPFEIKLDYVSEATPSFAFISVLSSRYGEFFTGSSSSVMYVDELRFNY